MIPADLSMSEALHLAAEAHYTERFDCPGCGESRLLCRAVYDDFSWLPPAKRDPWCSQDCMDNAAEQRQAGGHN